MKTWKKLLALLMALAMVFALVACDKDDDDDDDDDDKSSSSKDKDEDNDDDDDDADDDDDDADDDDDDDDDDDKDDTSDGIVGTWAIEGNYRDLLNAQLAASIDGFEGCDEDLPFVFSMKFKSNGELTLKIEMEQSDFDDYIDALCDELVDYLIDYAAANGMSEADYRAAFEQQYSMTLEDYCQQTMEASTADVVENANQSSTGYYKVEDGVIYTDKDEDNLEDVDDANAGMRFEIDGDTLIIDRITGDDSMAETLAEMGLELPWELEKQ